MGASGELFSMMGGAAAFPTASQFPMDVTSDWATHAWAMSFDSIFHQ
jgi:hypothetical protein